MEAVEQARIHDDIQTRIHHPEHPLKPLTHPEVFQDLDEGEVAFVVAVVSTFDVYVSSSIVSFIMYLLL